MERTLQQRQTSIRKNPAQVYTYDPWNEGTTLYTSLTEAWFMIIRCKKRYRSDLIKVYRIMQRMSAIHF